jgi:hypothetical protein
MKVVQEAVCGMGMCKVELDVSIGWEGRRMQKEVLMY